MPQIDDNVVYIAKYASKTSADAATKILPKTGSLRRAVYEAIANHGGLADFELEQLLGGKHQSISASRRSLVIDKFIVDSGQTRYNEGGNECTVWVTPSTELRLF
jgi:hypothetical protein